MQENKMFTVGKLIETLQALQAPELPVVLQNPEAGALSQWEHFEMIDPPVVLWVAGHEDEVTIVEDHALAQEIGEYEEERKPHKAVLLRCFVLE
jgi:hypothetical protein